jgi:uncharacterized protein YuzE
MIEDFYADAIDTVSTWDIDPCDFANTVNAYARLCAGYHLDESSLALLPSDYADTETRDLDEDKLTDLDRKGDIVAITIEHASTRTGPLAFSYEHFHA